MLEGIKRKAISNSFRLLHQLVESNIGKFFQNNGMAVNFYFDDDDTYSSLYQLVEDSLTPYRYLIEKLEVGVEKLPEEYFDRRRNQYNVKGFIEKKLGDKSRTAFEIYVTKEDIYAPHLNWAYGMTSPAVGLSVLSISRYSNDQTAQKLGLAFDESETKLMFKKEFGHEFGHIVGLLDHREGDHKDCVMDQTLHLIKELDEKVLEGKPKFCSFCESSLKSLHDKETRVKNFIDKVTRLMLTQKFGEGALKYLDEASL